MRLLDCNQHLWRRGIFVFALLLLLPAAPTASSATSGNQQYIARSWQADDGLPHNYVLTVMQARDGYVWVGTRSGLARFDGVRFTPIDWGPTKGLGIASQDGHELTRLFHKLQEFVFNGAIRIGIRSFIVLEVESWHIFPDRIYSPRITRMARIFLN